MKPYYSQNGITIYNADSREVCESVVADVLVTDPPYGVEFEGKATKHTVQRPGGYDTRDDSEVGPKVVSSILSRVKRGAVFTGIKRVFAYPEPNDIGCVYCPSGAGIGKWGFVCFHPVLFYGPRPSSKLLPTSIESFETAESCGHPCPKPLGWMKWIINLAVNPGETIVDPFAGSGTTLRAAKDLGYSAVGVEISEAYCEIAARRLEQQVFQFAG